MLLFYVVAGGVMSQDINYDAYLATRFNQAMIPDVADVIQDFYNDLKTSVSDLYALDLVLPLDRVEEGLGFFDMSVFIYEAPVDERYHLKRDYSLPLQSIVDRQMVLTLEPHPDADCSTLHLSETFESIELSFETTIQLILTAESLSNSLVIPDTCLMCLTRVERTQQRTRYQVDQLRFSHRNNRRPELIGLASTEIQNWNRFIYLETILSIDSLPLTSYTDTSADFEFIPDEDTTFAVPQASSLVLFEPELRNPNWDEYTVKMQFGRPNDPKCRVARNYRPGISFTELDYGNAFQVEYEIHTLSEPFSLDVLPDCELKLLSAAATITFASHLPTRNRFRCNMTPEIAEETFLSLSYGPRGLQTPMSKTGCLERLSDFPKLFVYSSRLKWFGITSFQTKDRFSPSLVAKNSILVLHSSVKDAFFQRDTVTLTFESEKDCQIKATTGLEIDIHRETRKIQVIYKSHVLNAKFPARTEFAFEASCNLKLIHATRLIKSKILDNPKLWITLDTEILH